MGTPSECVEYSLSEVRKHDSPDDLWLILYNKVYDLTKLADMHPGGAEVLFDCGGVDATEAFEDVGHSKVAFDMLVPYFVGKISMAEEKIYKSAGLLARNEKTADSGMRKGEKRVTSSKKGRFSAGLLIALSVLAFVGIICIQKLKWASLIT